MLALAALAVASLGWVQPAQAQRRGGVRVGAAPRGNAGAFHAGRQVGRHQGFNAGRQVGRHQGFNAGAHMGYHAGLHAGFHGHPWGYRAPMFWPWYPAGYFIAALATTAIIVTIVNDSGDPQPSGNVYYDQGVYYEKTSDGYKAIPAPPGAQISTLPQGYTPVNAGGHDYAYYQGDFYVENNGEYIIVKAPPGAIVPYLPDSATETTDGEQKFYDYNGTRYQAVSVSGDTSYIVSDS